MTKKKDMESVTMAITPQMAEYYLGKSAGNYRFSTAGKTVNYAVVARYAADMAAGRWKLSPQGIVFNTKDELIDGHHRLHAVIAANTTVLMNVVLDAPDECVDILDSGEKRNPYLALQHTQKLSTASASKRGWSIARMHFLYRSATGAKRLRKLPNTVFQEFICTNDKEIELAIHLADREHYKKKLTANAACYYAALSALKCGAESIKIEKIFEIATTGLYDDRKQTAAIMLRNKALAPTKNGIDRSFVLCDYAQTCLSDFLEGRPRAREYKVFEPVFTKMWFEKDGIPFREET